MSHQLPLFRSLPASQVVNVAQVKHRRPLRYPGGKTWLVPRIFQWLRSLDQPPAEFVEPFCGGAIVGLTVGFERLAEHVTLVELDEQVAAIWQTIINDSGGGEWLAQRIESFQMSSEAVEQLLEQEPATTSDRAFQALILNRTNRGGILAKGAGRIKHGENGKGIASRWYPKTLARRVRDIALIRDRFTFRQGDSLQILLEYAPRPDALYFIDPPYTAGGKSAGSRLYTYSELDHERLFQLAATLQGDLLLTYDNAPEVRHLAAKHGFDTAPIAMKTTHHARLTELLVGRDLAWAR
ncbi:MAG: DNA adenine methylase [Ardenticatenaceae bacterium]